MIHINRTTLNITAGVACLAAASLPVACSKSQSYSELLREEEKAVNLFLAGQKVCLELPADSTSFITGPDAPFYKLDQDGYVYMQVIDKGDANNRVQPGEVVYFRYERENLKAKYLGMDLPPEGNSDNLTQGNSSFVYKNTYLTSSTKWGTGIQMPLKFFGYDCEVNLVLQSYYGFMSDQTECMPYLINVRYFEPEY